MPIGKKTCLQRHKNQEPKSKSASGAPSASLDPENTLCPRVCHPPADDQVFGLLLSACTSLFQSAFLSVTLCLLDRPASRHIYIFDTTAMQSTHTSTVRSSHKSQPAWQSHRYAESTDSEVSFFDYSSSTTTEEWVSVFRVLFCGKSGGGLLIRLSQAISTDGNEPLSMTTAHRLSALAIRPLDLATPARPSSQMKMKTCCHQPVHAAAIVARAMLMANFNARGDVRSTRNASALCPMITPTSATRPLPT